QQAGSAFRNQTKVDKRGGEGRRRAGENVVAMKQHCGADADRDAIDRGDDRLDVVGQRIEELGGVGCARGTGVRGTVLQKILEIVTGCKYAGTAGNDDAANVRSILRCLDGLAHPSIHILIDRSLLSGPPYRTNRWLAL